jgi:hypothetical protein
MTSPRTTLSVGICLESLDTHCEKANSTYKRHVYLRYEGEEVESQTACMTVQASTHI